MSELKATSHLLLFLNYRLFAALGLRGRIEVIFAVASSCADPGEPSPFWWVFRGLSSANFFSTELLSVGVPGEAADVSNAAAEAQSQGHPKSRPFASPE